jgi:hypothetical protein
MVTPDVLLRAALTQQLSYSECVLLADINTSWHARIHIPLPTALVVSLRRLHTGASRSTECPASIGLCIVSFSELHYRVAQFSCEQQQQQNRFSMGRWHCFAGRGPCIQCLSVKHVVSFIGSCLARGNVHQSVHHISRRSEVAALSWQTCMLFAWVPSGMPDWLERLASVRFALSDLNCVRAHDTSLLMCCTSPD